MPPASNPARQPNPQPGTGPGPSQSSPTSASPGTAQPTAAPGSTANSTGTAAADQEPREFTVTIPTDKIFSTAADIVMTPVALARQVLPAKGGLPLYAGLGALAAVGIIEWPVAAAAGAGYALARYWTPHEPDKERPAEHPLTG